MIKSFLISCLLVFSIYPAYALEGVDECGAFLEELSDKVGHLDLDNDPIVKSLPRYGVYHFFDNETQTAYLSGMYPNYSYELDLSEAEIENIYDYTGYNEGAYISKINDVFINNLTQKEYTDAWESDNITLTLEENDVELDLRKTAYDHFYIDTKILVTSIPEINTKEGYFQIGLTAQYNWADFRLAPIAKDILESSIENEEQGYEGGFFCLYDREEITKFFPNLPSLTPKHFEKKYNPESFQVLFEYSPANEFEESENCIDEQLEFENACEVVKDGLVEFTVTEQFNGKVNRVFDLKKFPFDSHFLDIEMVQKPTTFWMYLWDRYYGRTSEQDSVLDENLRLIQDQTAEWRYEDYFHSEGLHYIGTERVPTEKIVISFLIERESSFYIYKIILPIFFILTLTVAIFWIDIRQIESRLTVSVVGFLTLIAYNFVIQDELPNLGYLTLMDKFVISSYVFAGIPTILTILSRRYYDLDNHIISKRIDQIYPLVAIPLFLIVLFVIYIQAMS